MSAGAPSSDDGAPVPAVPPPAAGDPSAARSAAGPPVAAARRGRGSRERLLGAAMTSFCERGYLATSVEDIAAAAGVSRMTFYRHFRNRADLATELFRAAAAGAEPRYLAIAAGDFRDRTVVVGWIRDLFAADRADRRLLQVFTQATSDPDGFTERAQQLIADLIARLGESIPAFAVDRDDPAQRRRWLEAWLLLYEILDQSNHAALDSGVAADPLVPEMLADRFLAFVTPGPRT